MSTDQGNLQNKADVDKASRAGKVGLYIFLICVVPIYLFVFLEFLKKFSTDLDQSRLIFKGFTPEIIVILSMPLLAIFFEEVRAAVQASAKIKAFVFVYVVVLFTSANLGSPVKYVDDSISMRYIAYVTQHHNFKLCDKYVEKSRSGARATLYKTRYLLVKNDKYCDSNF